jgi:tRNA(adenine34) deaminase
MTPNEKMAYVINLAKEAMDNGELPIAAAIYSGDELISSAYTTERADGRFLVHAEQKALMDMDMQKLPFEVRINLELYTNLEPCLMCLGMAISSFIGKVYYSFEAPEDGAVDLVRKDFEKRPPGIWHLPEISVGLLRKQSIQLFREYVERYQGNPEYSAGLIHFAKSVAEL